jgi:probable HAF family extracellular repeat protein
VTHLLDSSAVTGVNDKGQIIGSFNDANGRLHGFLATSNGPHKSRYGIVLIN